MDRIRPYIGPIAAVLIVLGIALVAWTLVLDPLIDYAFANSDDYELTTRQLASYRAIAATRADMESKLAAARNGETSLQGTLPGDSAAAAAAFVQGEIKRIIEQTGGEVRSAQVLPAKPTEGFEKIGVQYDLAVTPSDLQTVLAQIEAHDPYFFLENISIQAPETQIAGNAPAVKLSIRLQVVGYRKASL